MVGLIVVKADAEAVVVKVISAPIDVDALDESLAESGLQILRDGRKFGIVRVRGQFVGVVLEVEERRDIATALIVIIVETIHLTGGTVNGLLMRRIESDETAGKAMGGIDDSVQATGSQQFEIAVVGYNSWYPVAILPVGSDVIQHVGEGVLHVVLLDKTFDEGRQNDIAGAECVGGACNVLGHVALRSLNPAGAVSLLQEVNSAVQQRTAASVMRILFISYV